jgi:hypothetical protein
MDTRRQNLAHRTTPRETGSPQSRGAAGLIPLPAAGALVRRYTGSALPVRGRLGAEGAAAALDDVQSRRLGTRGLAHRQRKARVSRAPPRTPPRRPERAPRLVRRHARNHAKGALRSRNSRSAETARKRQRSGRAGGSKRTDHDRECSPAGQLLCDRWISSGGCGPPERRDLLVVQRPSRGDEAIDASTRTIAALSRRTARSPS